MAKMTIYVQDELRERMAAFDPVANWSRAASRIFERKVAYYEKIAKILMDQPKTQRRGRNGFQEETQEDQR